MMQIAEIKKSLQEHFTDGLVTIVGSGLSVASGIPGMEDLGQHLLEEMKKRCKGETEKEWEPVSNKLTQGETLEEALKNVEVDNPILEHIVDLTALYIESYEKKVLREVYAGQMELPFKNLLPWLSFNTDRVQIITTNYDRLIEVSAEISGFGVDTLFMGQYYGNFNPDLSKEALWTGKQTQKGKTIKRVYRKHIVVLKPHGSLDWFSHNGRPIRCTIPIDATRLMITPGQSKYRMGYEKPFDRHRDDANRAIDAAARFLIIGYGFNDDQLETHLTPEIKKGKPCLILTKYLSDKGLKLIQESKSILAVCRLEDKGKEGSKIFCEGKQVDVLGLEIWNLEQFIKEILQ